MNYKTVSFWRIIVISIIAYILIYMIPGYLFVHLEKLYVDTQKEVFENNLELLEPISSDSIFAEILTPEYDIELMKKLYADFGLESKKIEQKIIEPYGRIWKKVAFGELTIKIVTDFAKKIISRNVINYFYLLLYIFVGSTITFFIWRILLRYDDSEEDFIHRIINNFKYSKSFLSIIILMLYFITFVLSNRFAGLGYSFSSQLINSSDLGFMLDVLPSIIITLISLYILYLFFLTSAGTKIKWFSGIIEILIVLFILAIIIFSKKETNLFYLSYNIYSTAIKVFISEKMNLFVGLESLIAFISVLILMITINICLLYFIFKIIFPSKNVIRASYLLKFYAFSQILVFIIIMLNARVNVLNMMINRQYDNTSFQNIASIESKIIAETYQWYQQQVENGHQTEILPAEILHAVENIENTDFLKEWDGRNLKVVIKYNWHGGIVRSAVLELDAETGEHNILLR
ncbi:MAG: hypothetical protein U9P73_10375 [Candidatus Cloacimonadota bacterium]|nr:hypothetical protein [Candidatus Cloacimonadota bacterium]